VVTNQPDVRAGRTARETVEAMHRRLQDAVAVDQVRACYHVDADDCDCRKPKPGMILQAAAERGLDLAASFVVGDRWRDVSAGCAAGCRTVFIDLGYGEALPDAPDRVARDLPHATELILAMLAQPDPQEGREIRG